MAGGAGPRETDFIAVSLTAAVASGLTQAEFWAYTPYETQLQANAFAEKLKTQYRLALWQAWHAEAFARVKQLPKLDESLARLDGKPAQRMSGPEMLEAVRAMNAALGGKDLTQGDSTDG